MKEQKSRRFAFLLRNWQAKMGSILLALVLIVLNRGLTLELRIYNIPLNVLLHDSMVVAEPMQSSVQIRVRTDQRRSEDIRNENFTATVDFSNIELKGTYSKRIIIQRIGDALTLDPVELQIEPQEITVSLEKKLRKTVPVELAVIGFPATGFKVVSMQVTPDIIQIEGPGSLIEGIENVTTSEIAMANRRTSIVQRVRVMHENPLVSFPSGALVEFRAIIEETPILNTFEPVDIIVIDLAQTLRIVKKIETGSVRVQARVENLEDISAGDVQLIIDASSIRSPGTYTLKTEAQVPGGLNVLQVDPEVVDIVVDLTN